MKKVDVRYWHITTITPSQDTLGPFSQFSPGGVPDKVRSMGESIVTFDSQSNWRRALRVAAFAVLGVTSATVMAEPLTIYLYKENGMPVYSNVKPDHGDYKIVRVNGGGAGASRPTESISPPTAESETAFAGSATERDDALVGWAASCKGVNKETLDRRAVQWKSLVTKHAKAHGVPVALVSAVMRVESCFNPRAVSRVGARGLMQLMPDTAAHLGVSDSFDAEQNISGGVRYLSELLARFKNDTRLAVAAYNAGPSAVDAYRGIPPFPETRSYVQRVIAEYRLNSSNSKPKRSKT